MLLMTELIRFIFHVAGTERRRYDNRPVQRLFRVCMQQIQHQKPHTGRQKFMYVELRVPFRSKLCINQRGFEDTETIVSPIV